MSTRVDVHGHAVCVNWSHAKPAFTVYTYAAGSVPIIGMQVAKQVPFIHVRRALVVYHLQFPIYHLPSSSSERVRASLSFSFLQAGYRGETESKRKRAHNERVYA